MKLEQEKDPEVLRQAALILERENKQLMEMVLDLQRKILELQGKGTDSEQLRLKLQDLERQLAARNKALFGPTSERRSTTGSKPENEPQKGHGRRDQTQLRIVEDPVYDLDEPDKTCPQCGGRLQAWDGQFEQSELVDVVTREFVVRKIKRAKYRCACGACIETAPGPIKLCDGARYSIEFAIEVAIAKYEDHLPLERQVRTMRRDGLVVDSQTLWDQIERLARPLKDAYAAVLARVLASDVVFADETHWKLLGVKDQKKTWQVWTAACEDAVYYRIQDSRGTAAAASLLGDFEGTIMCDGYRAYSALADRYRCMDLAHCWSHVRRKFLEVEESFPDQVQQVLGMIGELYELEKLSPKGPPGDSLRLQLRQERSAPVIERMHNWAVSTPALPESGLGKAISYMTGLWSGLTRFLADARIPLDNNLAERLLRGPVLGRKNHYGSRSLRGTEVAALFYTLVETAKMAGVDPRTYLLIACRAGLQGLPVPLPHDLIPES
jgi:transposase